MPDETIDAERRRARRKLRVGSLAIVAVVAAGSPAGAYSHNVDKWWSGRIGNWTSGNWTTQHRSSQTLTFKTCSHNWGTSWGNGKNVEIHLTEVKQWAPDPILSTWRYACNNTDANMVSGTTNSTSFHFNFDTDYVAAKTAGTMTVRFN